MVRSWQHVTLRCLRTLGHHASGFYWAFPSMHDQYDRNVCGCVLMFLCDIAGLVVQEPVRGSRSHTVDVLLGLCLQLRLSCVGCGM